MPLVLTQKLVGGNHGDVVGKVYRFPHTWFKLLSIKEGERFVYYQPAEGKEGRCYFGEGIIEAVGIDPNDTTTGVAKLSQYRAFQRPVPHKAANGRYAESGDEAQPMFWWSLRFLKVEDLSRIVSMGNEGWVEVK